MLLVVPGFFSPAFFSGAGDAFEPADGSADVAVALSLAPAAEGAVLPFESFFAEE